MSTSGGWSTSITPPGFPDPQAQPGMGQPAIVDPQLTQQQAGAIGDSPFHFPPVVAPDPKQAVAYMPLNGKELGHVLYVRTRRSLDAHYMFQPGLVYKEADFTITLQISVPDGLQYTAPVANLTTMGRSGSEILSRLVQRFTSAMAGHQLFQEGLTYPLIMARLMLTVDRANDVGYETVLTEFQVNGDDSPDLMRIAHGLPTQAVVPAVEDPEEQEAPREATEQATGPVVEVGDVIRHPGFGNGKEFIVERVDDEGYHVRREGEADTKKIGVSGKVYGEVKIVRKGSKA